MARAVLARRSLKIVVGDIPAHIFIMSLGSLSPDEAFSGDVIDPSQHTSKMATVLVDG